MVRETENSKENPKVRKVSKFRTRVKPRRLVYLVFKKKKTKSEARAEPQESAQTYHTDNS